MNLKRIMDGRQEEETKEEREKDRKRGIFKPKRGNGPTEETEPSRGPLS